MVLLQGSTLDSLGIKEYIPNMPSAGNFSLFLAIIVGASLLLLVIAFFVYRWWKQKQFRIDVIIVESHDGVPSIRNKDRGRILTTHDGPVFEFLRERPLVNPAPPQPDHLVPAATVPSELLQFVAGGVPSAKLETVKSMMSRAWTPNRWFGDPVKGARISLTQTNKHIDHFIANARNQNPLLIFLYREGQYVPMDWDLKNLDWPHLKILKPTDVRFFLDMAHKLVKRHLLRDSWMSKFGPILAFMGVAAILIIGMVFLYLQNKDMAGVMQQSMTVSQQTLETAKMVVQPQGVPVA